MSTTVVTSLYNTVSDKLDLFKNLLLINCPMVIFIDKSSLDYVKQYRSNKHKTKIIVRKFESLKAWQYYDKIQKVTNDAKNLIAQYSKLDLLEEVSKQNPFDTEYFVWLEENTFQDEPTFNASVSWPDPYKMKIFGDKFLISQNNFNTTDKSPLTDKKKYILSNKDQILEYIHCGTRKSIEKIHKKFWEEIDDLLGMDLTTSLQIILQLLILESPKDFYLWRQTKRNYPKVHSATCDKMIPHELAVGTFIQEDYPVNKKLKVIAVATKELKPKKFQKWERTAKHFGYNYEIVGRNDKWRGFNTKIVLTYNKVKEVKEPFVILTDCSDIFFTGSSNEMYDKFISLKQDLIIGGELSQYCPKIKFNEEKIRKHFQKIGNGEHLYPNAGFIIGKTEEVLKLKELHLRYEDDQTACFETIYEGKMNLAIDYQTELIGNITNVPGIDTNRFVFDSITSRYKNMHSGKYPTAFHFPGGNFLMMDKFYDSIMPPDKITVNESLTSNNVKGMSIWAWVIIAIAVVTLILLMLLFP